MWNQKEIRCPACKIKLPDKKYLTEYGCYWCDVHEARRKNDI